MAKMKYIATCPVIIGRNQFVEGDEIKGVTDEQLQGALENGLIKEPGGSAAKQPSGEGGGSAPQPAGKGRSANATPTGSAG